MTGERVTKEQLRGVLADLLTHHAEMTGDARIRELDRDSPHEPWGMVVTATDGDAPRTFLVEITQIEE